MLGFKFSCLLTFFTDCGGPNTGNAVPLVVTVFSSSCAPCHEILGVSPEEACAPRGRSSESRSRRSVWFILRPTFNGGNVCRNDYPPRLSGPPNSSSQSLVLFLARILLWSGTSFCSFSWKLFEVSEIVLSFPSCLFRRQSWTLHLKSAAQIIRGYLKLNLIDKTRRCKVSKDCFLWKM